MEVHTTCDHCLHKYTEPTAESAEDVPTIQVSSEPTALPPAPPETTNDTSKTAKRRESKNLEVKKPAKTLPTQEVIKGYLYRKKPGLGSRWEKTYCVVSHTAMYFTEVEGNSEYEHMFQVVAGEAVFSEKDKGHDKNSKVERYVHVHKTHRKLYMCGLILSLYLVSLYAPLDLHRVC